MPLVRKSSLPDIEPRESSIPGVPERGVPALHCADLVRAVRGAQPPERPVTGGLRGLTTCPHCGREF